MNRFDRRSRRLHGLSGKLVGLFVVLLLISFIEIALIWWRVGDMEPKDSNQPMSQNGQLNGQSGVTPFDKSKYSINETSSLWVVVNKGRILPSGYVPDDLAAPDARLRFSPASSEMKLRPEATAALEQLFAAAATEKINLRLASGYRSYNTQSIIYAREVRTYGQTQADRQSARPGHSEHQTGLAADFSPADGRCEIADCFADTAEGKWLAANAYKYGFVLRYPDGKESATGYRYEPWHFRFVGNGLAAEINRTGQTLEQFFDLPAFIAYPDDIYELR